MQQKCDGFLLILDVTQKLIHFDASFKIFQKF